MPIAWMAVERSHGAADHFSRPQPALVTFPSKGELDITRMDCWISETDLPVARACPSVSTASKETIECHSVPLPAASYWDAVPVARDLIWSSVP